MYSHLEPRESYSEPTRMPGEIPAVRGSAMGDLPGMRLLGMVEEWRYDTDGTRYRAIVVRLPTDRVLVAIDPDKHHGRSWWVLDWRPGDVLADDYIAEKWRVMGDNVEHVARLIRAALGRP